MSLGCHVPGYLQPHPDQQHVRTIVDGAKKRIGCVLPTPDPEYMRKFGAFVHKWLRENLDPLDENSDDSFETWLLGTKYPEWRKEELREAHASLKVEPLCDKDFECKSFIKDEHYPEYKHARTINSRSDRFKVWSGPIFALIEKQVFKLRFFIKKVPARLRARFVMDNVFALGASYVCTDYSSFESSFVKEMLDNCEFKLYEYMSSRLVKGHSWYSTISRALSGLQNLRFKRVTVTTLATRMSGDMCTSLGNGFTNLMSALFAAHEEGLGDLFGVFEGDDGLMRFSNGVPSGEHYTKLGFNIKMEVVDDISQASFCGLVFDERSGVNCVDPSDVLSLVGWTNNKYFGANSKVHMALLRSKALSLAYQYPHAPVVCRLAAYLLRATRSYDVRRVANTRNMSMWDREQLLEALDHSSEVCETVTEEKARWIVEEKWGWSVAKQIRVEKYLDSLESVVPLEVELDNCVWAEYWRNFVGPANTAKRCDPAIFAGAGKYQVQ